MPKGYKVKVSKSKDKQQDKRIAKLEREVGDPEYKQLIVTNTQTLTANTLDIDFLCTFTRGVAAQGAMIGNKVKIHEIRVSGYFIPTSVPTIGSSDTVQIARCLLFGHRNNNLGGMVAADALFGSTSLGWISMPNFNAVGGQVGTYLGTTYNPDKPINIYADTKNHLRIGFLNKTDYVPNAAGNISTVSSGGLMPYAPFNFVKKFPRGHMFSVNNADDPVTDGDAVSGALYLAAVASTSTVSWNYEVSIMYTDV